MLRIVFACLLFFQLSSVSYADKRVALVIGNSAYSYAGELASPKNDATDMAAVLRKDCFQVIDGFDLDKPAFDRKVRDERRSWALQDAVVLASRFGWVAAAGMSMLFY